MRKQRLAALVLFSVVVVVGCDSGSGSSNSPSASSRATSSPPLSSAKEDHPAAESRPSEETVVEANEGWGHLKGKFIYDGSPPVQSPLTITKDAEICGKHDVVDESLVVNKANRGLANVVVYLYVGRGKDAPKSHQSYGETADARVELDNNNCRFEPHVCLLRTSQTLVIKNSDSVGHNTNIAVTSNPSFNQMVPGGSELELTFMSAERRPATVGCNIHPWMQGWLLPQDTPYFAVSGKDGEFEIHHLPSGKWTFQVWHERAGSVDQVTIDGKATKWSRGRVEVTIDADGVTDLGAIELSPSLFR